MTTIRSCRLQIAALTLFLLLTLAGLEAREQTFSMDRTSGSLQNARSGNTGSNLSEHSPGSSNSPKNGSGLTHRLREGTIINDQTGYFSENGDGASFVSDSGMEFGALQNLNLERVVRLLKNADEPSSIRWSVTGTITEFSGRNYLLISRAVYKSATPPPVPDRVAK